MFLVCSVRAAPYPLYYRLWETDSFEATSNDDQSVSKTLHGDKLFNEPMITCPSCKTDIKLNESLAAPLIAATREEHEERIAQTNAAIAVREEELERQRQEIEAAKEDVERLVAEKVRIERGHIAADEDHKAKLLLSTDLDERNRKVAELEEILKARNAKLEQAQKQQAELSHEAARAGGRAAGIGSHGRAEGSGRIRRCSCKGEI